MTGKKKLLTVTIIMILAASLALAACSADKPTEQSDDAAELENFKKRKYQYMAKDKEGRDVFLADSGYVLSMAQEDFKHIKFHFTSEF